MKLSNMINSVNNYINNKKETIAKIDTFVNNSSKFTLDKEIVSNEDNIVTCNIYEYKEMCAYLNQKYASLIDSIIPVDETVISIVNTIEKISNEEYFIVFTSRRIIVMNETKYTELSYKDINKFGLVNKGFMTQIVCFNDVILDMNIPYDDLTIVYNIATNTDYRNQIISSINKYLCGITPIYQKINKFKSGISIGTNNEIVFHNKKEHNYLCKYDEIDNYELMEDNTSVMRKWTRDQSQAIGFSKKECYKMTIRITMKNKKVFDITILEPNSFNNSYHHTDKTYLEYFEFGKGIIEKLDTYNEEKRNFS